MMQNSLSYFGVVWRCWPAGESGGVRTAIAALLIAILALLTGCQAPQTKVEPLVARFHLETRSDEAGVRTQLPTSGIALVVGQQPVLSESDIVGVDVVKVRQGWGLVFGFSDDASRRLYQISLSAPQRRLVLTFNNIAVGAIRLDQPVSEGRLLIFAEVPDVDLPPIADRIRRTSQGISSRDRNP